jgi:hypothetical protein
MEFGKMERSAVVGGLFVLFLVGVAGCRTMTPAVGTTVLEDWLFDDDVSVLLTREGRGEWAPVPDQTWARPDFVNSMQAILDAIVIRIDVVGRRVTVGLDAADAVWTDDCSPFGPCRTPTSHGPTSRGGAPILDVSFDDIAGAITLMCDPDSLSDGTDRDGNPRNDCPFNLGGTSCPLWDDCQPLAGIDGILGEISGMVDEFAIRLDSTTVTWEHEFAGFGDPEPPRPVLHFRFRAAVDFALSSWYYMLASVALDYQFSYFEGSVLLPIEVGDGPCDTYPFWACDTEPDNGQGLTWLDFTPALPEAHWETRNLVLAEPDAPWQHPSIDGLDTDLAFELTDTARGVIRALYGDAEVFAAEADLRDAVLDIKASLRDASTQIARLVRGYLTILQDPGGPTVASWMVWGAIWTLPDPGGAEPGVAQALLMRFVEGAAGASRYFWNAVTEPLEMMDAYTGVSSFQFVGAHPDGAYPWRTAGFDLKSDTDCDGIADDADLCPTLCSLPSEADDDGDLLGNSCDGCMLLARADSALPRNSSEYSGGYRLSFVDSDRDGVDNRCDWCPGMNATVGHPDSPDPRRADSAAIDLESWAHGPPAGYAGIPGTDDDGDGIGNWCDNCPNNANRDQWNCNADWEELNGWLADPPRPGIVGWGDACDTVFPCVDACIAPDVEPMLHIDSLYGTAGWASPPDDDVASVAVCPDMLATATPIDTHVRGCKCDEEEVEDGRCQRLFCPGNGTMGDPGNGWFDADYDGVPRDEAESILPTPYEYEALYSEAEALGRLGSRSGRGRFQGYAAYYAGLDRTKTQEWNWLEDACGGSYGTICGRPWLKMWFRPESTTGSSFPTPGGYWNPAYGNTYTQQVQADGEGIPSSLPTGFAEAPCGGGGGSATGLTTPFNMDEQGRLTVNSGPLIDILRVPCLAEWGPCPRWNDALLFDEPGLVAAGMTVSNWSRKNNDLGWTLGAKVKPGFAFDLVESGSAAEFDANGDPYRIWLFGGRMPDGGVSDQMWGATLVLIGDAGVVRSVDATGLPVAIKNAVAPDVSRVRYDLSPIARANVWPAPRAGATLACTGQVAASGGPCKENCPKIEVALGLAEPPDGITKAAGSLVLVGGEGAAGPLDDIWVYEERATLERPAGAAASDPGPWPSGWRRLASIPGVAGGLSDAGTVQLGSTLWLVGGRSSAGVTADAFRIDLATGEAQRVAAVGAIGGRTTPAVAFDFTKPSLLVFGGTDGTGRALNDVWRIDTATGQWSQVVPACTGNACPIGGGRPSMFMAAPSGEITVIPDRGLVTPATVGWTLTEGGWKSVGEKRGDLAVADCNADGAVESLYGSRCGQAGGGGFPNFGRMRCNGSNLECRAPLKPASTVNQYSTPNFATVVAAADKLFGLRGAQVDVYELGVDGGLTLLRTTTLARAGSDLAVAGGALVVADAQGASFYRIADGALLSSVPTCGRARRVFVDGTRAYVVGILSLLALDVSDVSAPEVLQRVRLLVGPRELAMHSSSGCGWFDSGADRLFDAVSGGGFGRSAAAYDHGRLFLHVLGGLHVLDVRNPSAPTVLGSVPVGFVRDLRVENGFLYGNRPGRRTWVVAEQAGTWAYVGEHDVRAWVEGTVDAGEWTIHWEAGRVQVATRQ